MCEKASNEGTQRLFDKSAYVFSGQVTLHV